MQPPEFMRAIVDADLDSDGALSSRPGIETVRALADGRRILSKGGMLLCRDGDSLDLLDLDAEPQASTLIDGELDPDADLLAHEWPTGGDRAFVTDGTLAREVRSGVVRSWGLPVPADPTVTRISGSLPAGGYLVAVTFRDGPLSDPKAQESGARAPLLYTLTASGGLSVTATVTSPWATHVSFWCSAPDQSEPMRAAVVAVGESATVTAALTSIAQVRASEAPLITQGWQPPPSGICAIGSFQSFLMVAVGNVLYRSWPGVPGLFRYKSGLQLFPAPITAIVGLQDGAWIGTEGGLYWLSGERPESWGRVRVTTDAVLPEGALGDGAWFPKLQVESPLALFATRAGLVAGLPGGQARHLTRDVYHFATARRVSIAYRDSAPRALLVAVT